MRRHLIEILGFAGKENGMTRQNGTEREIVGMFGEENDAIQNMTT